MKSLWLYLHFPQLQLDELIFQQHGLEQQVRPLVVLDADKNNVRQLNQQAKNTGIQLDMGLATAAALCRDLEVVPYQAEIEQHKLAEIAQCLYLITSDISFYQPDGLLLRIHNMLNLYGGLIPYWQTVKGQLATLNLVYQYASGYSPFSAKMLATKGFNQVSGDIDLLRHSVSQCNLDQTELSTAAVQKLKRVGVCKVGELVKIPLAEVAKRFDIELVTYLGRLSGEFQHPQVFFHPQKGFSRYLELLYEIDNNQLLLRPLKLLLTALERFLKIRDQLTNELHLSLYQRDKAQLKIEIGSGQGEYQASKWLTLAALKLENIQLEAPVFAITLSSGKTSIRSPDKVDLFTAKRGSLSNLQLVALLQAKLGEQAVQSPHLANDFRPEIACTYGAPLSGQTLENRLQGLRPSFLLPQPQPLTEQVSILHGPERIVSGWWDKQEMLRDYFIARSGQGRWYWVFKTAEGKWYLHGVFS